MDEILETLSNTSGIDATMLISKDGLVISQAGRLDDVEVDLLGATASELYGSADSLMGEKSARGSLEGVVFEAARGNFFMSSVNDEVFLLVLARKKANLGLVRWEARESAGKLKDVM